MKIVRLLLLVLAGGACAGAQMPTATLRLNFDRDLGPAQMDHISLGQAGLSPDPMWDSRIAEIRALHPKLIRLFVQQYFDVLPSKGNYRFGRLDSAVDEIVRAGARPIMTITVKPMAIFPKVDQDIVEPASYAAWEELMEQMVKHYEQRGLRGLYWEVANEPDLGESGGSPSRFTAENYPRFYEHTAMAVLRADPTAHVGGPALAGWTSPILPALLEYCDKRKVPLGFVSWHGYDSDPRAFQASTEGVKALLAHHPSLHPELILDEWNMALTVPPADVRIQPAFVLETAWRMRKSGVTYSCYYHIRDYHVDRDLFARFFSLKGASFMANWWNRMPQYDGLFDYQNVMRPAYFSFALLARETGDELEAKSDSDAVHAILTWDASYGIYNLVFWNFSSQPATVKLQSMGLKGTLVAKRRVLDAVSPSEDENARLWPLEDKTLEATSATTVDLGPYGIETWMLTRKVTK
ncbi:MAG: hypothetical protein JSS95_12395 [Acidobacteria bacterium]|nr:hypothetical protein [Acidobacteriota bacterium]